MIVILIANEKYRKTSKNIENIENYFFFNLETYNKMKFLKYIHTFNKGRFN